MESLAFKRMVVIGATSSGKSTLAKQVAERLSLDFVELDALHWEANWHEADKDVFRSRVDLATRAERWIVAGNYSIARNLVWPRAEAMIWLDYAFPIVFWRLTRRVVWRGITREELWNGNREKFWWHLKLWSDESLFRWLFKTYWRRKREIPQELSRPDHMHLKVFHFTSPKETERWIQSLFVSPS